MFTYTLDVAALKGSYFGGADNNTKIFQHDLLCMGNEATLLRCRRYYDGERDCPSDHSEDASVKCNGEVVI